MTSIPPEDYEPLKGFFIWMVNNVWPIPPGLAPEEHPVALMQRYEGESMTIARKSLGMAIGDTIELTQDLPPQRVAEIDAALAAAVLPTLSAVRARFWSKVARIMKSEKLRGEDQYYALRNVVEAMPPSEAEAAWRLLADYEERVSARRPQA